MKQAILILLVFAFGFSYPLQAAGQQIPAAGYSVSGRGYVLPKVSSLEHGAVDFIWNPSRGALTFRAGASVPAGDRWFADAVVAAGLDITLFRAEEHIFRKWISHESRYAPAFGGGVTCALSESPSWYLSADIQPLRFEVGGGVIALLSPSIYWDPTYEKPFTPTGWGIRLFDFGFFVW